LRSKKKREKGEGEKHKEPRKVSFIKERYLGKGIQKI